QVQVQVIKTGPVQALLDAAQGLVGVLEPTGQLGGDEQLVPRDPGGARGRTDRALVLVVDRSVQQAVATVQRFPDDVHARRAVELVRAETDSRVIDTVRTAEMGQRGRPGHTLKPKARNCSRPSSVILV